MKKVFLTMAALSLFCGFILAGNASNVVGYPIHDHSGDNLQNRQMSSTDEIVLWIEPFNEGSVKLSWEPLANAASYLVYCADLPLAISHSEWQVLEETTATHLIVDATPSRQFFYVKAVMQDASSDFVYIHPGTFLMGNERDDQPPKPVHSVTLGAYLVCKHQVTQAEYVAIMGSIPAQIYGEGDNYPVYYVNWASAIKYCNLRSLHEGLQPVYIVNGYTDPEYWTGGWNTIQANWNAHGYRLPTEAEWEYAARGGTNFPNYRYSGSDAISQLGWYTNNSGHSTHPVCSKMPNGLGIYDMSGNVWEWCWDWVAPYTADPVVNPTGPAEGTERILRGGGFNSVDYHCRVSWRVAGNPAYGFNTYGSNGFRVVRKTAPLPDVEAPVISPEPGVFTEAIEVSISCATPGAVIRYTINGGNPDQNSPVYTGPFTVQGTFVVRARAYKDAWYPSEIVSVTYGNSELEGMIYIPACTFSMGDTRGVGLYYERPVHTVSLNPYYMAQYEVTQAEYESIMGYNPAVVNIGLGDDYPVYYTQWYHALVYCNLRSIAEGLTPVYTIAGSTDPADWGSIPSDWNDAVWDNAICNWAANGYRLPTEAEWECAARGATNDPDYLYSGSDDADAVAWYSGDGSFLAGVKPVGTKAPNGIGIFDMSGNVQEWCWDRFYDNYYSYSPVENPTGHYYGNFRVHRGGYWYSDVRISARGQQYPGYKQGRDNGFRVCRSAQNE